MLGQSPVTATVAVSNLTAGKEFYGGLLGLSQVDENPGGVLYESGGAKLFVYESQTAGTGQATCASWEVTNIESVVDALKEKGVSFDHFDLPGGTWEGDIAVMGSMKSAWFKDPDGNVLNVDQSR